MESEIHYARVGLFLSFSMVVALVIIGWLTGIATTEKVDRYNVFFKKQSLDGLQRDSIVTMRGIRVGVVEDYEIAGDDIERVNVVLKLDNGVPVKTDTKAMIKRNLLTGLAKIDLVGGTQAAEIIAGANTAEGSYPVIEEEVPQIDKIANSVPDLLEKVEVMTARLAAVLSEDNVRATGAMIQSLSEFSVDLASSGPALAGSMENLENITRKASRVIEKISGPDGNQGEISPGVVDELSLAVTETRLLVKEVRELNASMAPSLRKVVRSVDAAQRDLERISQGVHTVADGYGDPRAILAEPAK